jgi:titin
MVAPVVVDLDLEDTSVYRTETVRLWINATDEYDAPDGLTVLVEHQLEGETAWRTSMLGSLSFIDGLWWRDVTPDRYQTPGVYSFRVNVTDSDREASGYVEFPSTLEVLPNLLGAPRLLVATAGAASVELEWRSPLDMGDLPVVGYRVLRGTSEGDLSVIDTVDQFAEGYTDTGLVNGVTYYYAIVAFNDLGDSPWSDVLNATPIDVPGPPQSLTVESGDGTMTLTWEPPLLDGGTPVLGYHILRGDAADSLIEIADIGDVGEFTDEGLTNGVTYYYAVLAHNDVGPGPRTEPVAATPLGLPGAPDGLTSEVGTLGITLRWQAPGDTGGGDIIGFIIYRGLADDALEVEESVSGSTTQFLDDDVTAGTTYYYAIAAETAAGEGPMSTVVEVAALGHPGVPKEFSAEAGDGKVILEWLSPDSDGGSPITGYVILRGASPSSLEDLAELSDILSYVDTTAVNGETYHYAVIALNALGRGTATDAVEATPFEPTYVPGKVTALNIEVKGTKAVLVWATPADDGGSPITGYVILRGETRDTMVEIDQVGLVLTYTDEGLERGTTYYYSVRAVNDVGQGDAFDPQTVKVEKKDSDDGGFPIAILIAVAAIIVIAVVAMFMRPGRKDGDEQEAPREDPKEDPEEVPEEEGSDEEGSDEGEPEREIVIEHREV